MADCIFCTIAKGKAPARVVLERPELLAFEDLHPQAPVHVLLVPREHVATLNDLREDHALLVGKLVLAAAQVAQEKGIARDGYRLLANCNAHGGQAIYHLHFHLLGGRPLGPKLVAER
jgi:histidine triad (HIT) family protein